MKERLDKILSNQLNISRSDSRRLIKIGKVSVNGAIVRSFGFVVNPETDVILADFQKIEYKKFLYIMLNKPKGVLSATEDKSRKTVVDLLPVELRRKNIAPVGRLDKDTTGLLLLTDDGDFSHNIISPKKNIKKVYIAEVDGEIPSGCPEEFKKGVTLADGTKCLPAEFEIISNNSPFICKITVNEGKYHQVKRMLGIFNLGVNELKRVKIGGLELDNMLKPGEYKILTENEKNQLFV